MAHDIFISYSHVDKPIADAICANIEAAGIRCWIAPRDIAPGQDWPTAIVNAIKTSRIMVLVFSTDSNSSNEVGRELILAANNNLIIIPFKIGNVTPEPGKQYYLARTHWLDALNPPTQEQIDKLVAHAKSFTSEPSGTIPVKPTSVAASTPDEINRPVVSAAPVSKTPKPTWKNRWLWGLLLMVLLIGVIGVVTRPFGLFAFPALPTTTQTAPSQSTVSVPTISPTSISILSPVPATPTTRIVATSTTSPKTTVVNTGIAYSWANSGLNGKTIKALAIDPKMPSTIYAGTTASIFKSIDGGGNWNAINTGLSYDIIYALAIDPVTPSTIYIGAGGLTAGTGGILKSTDGGANWGAVPDGTTGGRVFAITIDPKKPATLYVGRDSGAFKSSDGGLSWSKINTGFDFRNSVGVFSLAIDSSTPTTLYAGTGGGVYKSMDSGENWAQTSLKDGNVRAILIDPTAPMTLYASNSLGVYKSTNGGGNWSPANTGLPNIGDICLTIDPKSPNMLYAGTFGNGVFKSIDGGANWNSFNAGKPESKSRIPANEINVLAINPALPSNLYSGTGDGIYVIR